MNKASLLILVASTVVSVTTLAAPLAMARGGSSDGGGKGVVCRNVDGSIRSVELLDLWEARVIYKRNIVSSDAPVEALVAEGIERLQHAVVYPWGWHDGQGSQLHKAEAFKAQLKSVATYFLATNYANVQRLSGVRLKPTDDSFEEAEPSDCGVEQIVRYKDVGVGGGADQILVNQDLVERMDNTNRAALVLHEALYRVMREFGERTSIRARRAVGYVMSGQTFKSLESILEGPRVTCASPRLNHLDAQRETKVHFYQMDSNGRPVLALAVERFNGALAMGFDQPMSGLVISAAAFFKSLLHSSGGSGGGIPFAHSPTDFDTQIRYSSLVGSGKARIQLEMLSNPGGVETPSKIDLNCQYFAK